jgi:hypothetical protein
MSAFWQQKRPTRLETAFTAILVAVWLVIGWLFWITS